MFKRIFLKNFKSFREIDFDLRGKAGNGQKYVSIYGENGSGKSNLAESVGLLTISLRTLTPIPPFDNIPSGSASQGNQKDSEFIEYLDGIFRKANEEYARIHPITEYVSRIRTIGSEGEVVLSFVFEVNGKDAEYEITFGPDNRLIRESLRYVLEKRCVNYYRISLEEGKIAYELNGSVFGKPLIADISKMIEKLWGNHSMLAILFEQYRLNNPSYMESNVGIGLVNVLRYLWNVKAYVSDTYAENFGDITNGRMPASERGNLDRMERALDSFFTRIYSDVRRVHYILKEDEDYIDYRLCFDRIIGGKVCEIDWFSESRGTQKLIQMFPYLLGAVHGQVSFVDEMDSNIHDLLMKELIESIVPDVKGQLIVTTHNTLLLENADPRSVYILQVDAEGGRSIQPMSSIERTQKNHNNRKRYLDGVMGGIPYMGEIYMSEIEREYFGGRNAS